MAVDIDDLYSVRRALVHAHYLRQVRRWRGSGLLLQTLEVCVELCAVDSHFTSWRKFNRTWCRCRTDELARRCVVCRGRAVKSKLVFRTAGHRRQRKLSGEEDVRTFDCSAC